jgi:hypothetical protein
MSKVLRRPMFKGGSTGMNGIMSGIKDRENYQKERFHKLIQVDLTELRRHKTYNYKNHLLIKNLQVI